MDYVGNMRAMVYITEQVINLREYGEKSVQTRSRFYTQQMENSSPTYLGG